MKNFEIKTRESDTSYQKIIERGNIIFKFKGREWKMPYRYMLENDDVFTEYDRDIRLEITKEMEKNFTPDEIDEMRDEIEENFDDIKIV